MTTADPNRPAAKFSFRTHPGPVGFIAAFSFMCMVIGALHADWLLVISNVMALPFVAEEFRRRRDALTQTQTGQQDGTRSDDTEPNGTP